MLIMKKIFLLLLLIIFACPQAILAKTQTSSIPENSGYVGTLPDLESRFKKSSEETSIPAFETESGFNDKDDIKPAPRNNPAFVNIIVKKDKTSQYINDLNGLILILQQLENTMETKDSLQLFSAKSYYFKENVEYFRDKYSNRAEGSYPSFKKVMQINTHIQAVSQLRQEKEVYSPYITSDSNGNAFSQNNITQQMSYLLDDIKSTIVLLKDAN